MSILAAILYIFIALAALIAAHAARKMGRTSHDMLHWIGIACGFVLLAVARFADVEDRIRVSLREWILAQDLYADRGEYQSVLAVVVIVVVTAVAFTLWRIWMRRRRSPAGKARFLALVALSAYLPLWALRLVSFHGMDRILYGSPLHLNWLIDGSLALTCGGCALFYARELLFPPRQARR